MWGSTFLVVQDAVDRMRVTDFLTWRFGLATLAMVALRPRSVLILPPAGRRIRRFSPSSRQGAAGLEVPEAVDHSAGAEVTLAVRNIDAGTAAAADVMESTGGTVLVTELDLADQPSSGGVAGAVRARDEHRRHQRA